MASWSSIAPSVAAGARAAPGPMPLGMAGREGLGRLDHGRGEGVELAVRAEAGEAGIREGGRRFGRRRPEVGGLVTRERLRPQAVERGRPGGSRGGREAPVGNLVGQADHVEQLAAAIRRQRADPHPRQDLAQAVLQRVEEVRLGGVGVELLLATRSGDLARDGDAVPGVDRVGAGREQHGDGVDVEGVAALHQHVAGVATARGDERGVDRAGRQQARERDAAGAGFAVGEHEQVGAAVTGSPCVGHQPVEGRGEARGSVRGRERGIQR